MTDVQDDPTPAPTVAPALPPAVASGELITSAWGNAVVNSLKLVNQTRPYLRFTAPDNAVAPSVNQQLTLGTGATNVYDPNSMLGAGAINIPAGWPGLWIVSASYLFGSHAGVSQVAGWIQDPGGVRYGAVQAIADAAKAQILAGTATVIAGGGQAITLWSFNQNGSAVHVQPEVSVTWIGHAP